jgi:hypothetical protein
MNILILGHARHGKDTVAEMMAHHGLTFKGSSEAALEIFLFDVLNDKYGLGYKTREEAFEDRVNHRSKWYAEICDYNSEDQTRLAREIMETSDIYVGLRAASEIEACMANEVFDLIIGVHDYRKPLEPKSSNDADPFKYADFIIPNSGDLRDLKMKVDQLVHGIIL